MSKTIINPFIFPSVILGADFVNATDYDAAVLADGPELFWKLDEASGTTATDSSGNGRNGTYGSAVTVGDAGLFGGADKCPTFVENDDDSVVTSTYGDNLTTACTLECIVEALDGQPQGAPINGGYLINKYRPNAAADFPIKLGVGVQDQRRFNLALSQGNDLLLDNSLNSVPVFEQNGKFHVAVVYRDSGLCEVYVNGLQRNEVTIGYAISSTTALWAFGRVSTPVTNYINNTSFKGRAGRVAIYSTDLSASQILAHYNAAIFP